MAKIMHKIHNNIQPT